MQLIGTRMKVVEGATYQIDNIRHLVHGNSINRVVSHDFVCDRIHGSNSNGAYALPGVDIVDATTGYLAPYHGLLSVNNKEF